MYYPCKEVSREMILIRRRRDAQTLLVGWSRASTIFYPFSMERNNINIYDSGLLLSLPEGRHVLL